MLLSITISPSSTILPNLHYTSKWYRHLLVMYRIPNFRLPRRLRWSQTSVFHKMRLLIKLRRLRCKFLWMQMQLWTIFTMPSVADADAKYKVTSFHHTNIYACKCAHIHVSVLPGCGPRYAPSHQPLSPTSTLGKQKTLTNYCYGLLL